MKIHDPATRRPRRRAGPAKGPESLTLEQRATARRNELERARREAEANPDDMDAQTRFATARRAHAAHMSIDELEERARTTLDLIASGMPTTEIVKQLQQSYMVSDSGARAIIERAVESLPSLTVGAYRSIVVARLEKLAQEAKEAGDFASAVRAVTSAAKLSGVTEKIEVTAVVQHEVLPKSLAKSLSDPRIARFYLENDRVPEPGELDAPTITIPMFSQSQNNTRPASAPPIKTPDIGEIPQ